MEAMQLLLELIRVAVCGQEPTEALKQACTPEALEAVYSIGADHDLAHLVGQGAAKLQLSDSEALRKCKKAAMEALVRQTRQEIAYQTACKILEQGKIPFLPLKGSVLRRWYPEAWMRTSCDMDILVPETDVPGARDLLEKANWRYVWRSSHDISLFSPEGVHLELHHTTLEDCVSQAGAVVMAEIWQDAKPLPGKQYHMEISDGLFYYYHMAHMAKHVLTGGCGIRSFLDVWILNHRVEFDPKVRADLLDRGGLTAFGKAAEKLAEIWFSGAPMDEMSKGFQAFICNGGTYGNLENQVNLNQAKKGSKLRFIWERIFLPYSFLKYSYPVLQKHKWLTPVFWVVRWFRLLFGGKLANSVAELKKTTAVTADMQKEACALLHYLEL